MTRKLGLLLLAMVPAVLSPATATVDDFFRNFTDEWMRFHTDQAASSRYFTGPEQDVMERQIRPQTMAARDAERKLVRKGLAELRAFDRSKMTDSQKAYADIIIWDLQNRVDGEQFQDYSFPLVQTDGAQAALPGLMTVQHPVVTARDAENYVVRLRQLAPRMEEAIVEARRLIAKKLAPPKFILEDSIAQIDVFLATPPARNPLVQSFADRMLRVKDLPQARQAELRASAEKITAEDIYPRWNKAKALLEAQLPKASTEAGLWHLRDGVEAYQHALRRYTTTKMKADDIHELGLRVVAEIEARMDALLRPLGYAEGTVRARIDKLRADQQVFPPTPEGRAAYEAEIEKVIRDAEKRAVFLFDRVPKGAVIARPYPEFMGPRAASYTRGAPDGSRPGVYQFPEYGVTMTRFAMRSTAYHEAVPGHHFQNTLIMEDPNLPGFLRNGIFGNNSANGEGWGLYAERLAAENGWYDGDPVGLLGQLDAEIFRARRLVVDTGMHAKHWTRQQAMDYLGPNPAGSAAAEIDRYVMRPGQACSYMVGELKLVELRERARKSLGDGFSVKEYHDLVLGMGRVPLDVMEQQVDKWIASKKAAAR